MVKNNSLMCLKNLVRTDRLTDPVHAAQTILQRATKEQVRSLLKANTCFSNAGDAQFFILSIDDVTVQCNGVFYSSRISNCICQAFWTVRQRWCSGHHESSSSFSARLEQVSLVIKSSYLNWSSVFSSCERKCRILNILIKIGQIIYEVEFFPSSI